MMRTLWQTLLLWCVASTTLGQGVDDGPTLDPNAGQAVVAPQEAVARTPAIAGPWWRICEMPDLGDLNGPEPRRQHIVDHGFIQACNGKWQLWACMRGTAVSRLLYGWEGDSLEAGPWTPRGVVARAEAKYGEQIRVADGKRAETMQAPFFMQLDGIYHCFYNSAGIRLMTSENGIDYQRAAFKDTGTNLLYPDGGRDVMVLKIGDTFYSYSTISTRDGRGYVNLKTSQDLRQWSRSKAVCEGGRGGVGPVTSESPFVVALDGYYYLFRASSMTFKTYVYRSKDPAYFGIDDDRFLVATLPIKAPEIIHNDGKWYISDLADFQGVNLARLHWTIDGQ